MSLTGLSRKEYPVGKPQKPKRSHKKQFVKKAAPRNHVRRYGVVLAVVLGLFGAAVLFSPTDQSGTPADFIPQVLGAPRVAVAQEEVDFGDVKLDKTVEAVFRVRNVGDEVLRILDDEPSVELIEGC
jgi:hypothetical protein